jgi:hypothetical protein
LTDKNTITFTGTDFYTSDAVASAQFFNVNADTITVVSATEVNAIWNLGVPI